MDDTIYVALDVEATGLSDDAEIIEVGAVKFRRSGILERYNTLVQPRDELPLKVSRLTGITQAELDSAPTFNAIGAQLAAFIGKHPLVLHAQRMDLIWLKRAGMSFSQPTYDTFELSRRVIQQVDSRALGKLSEHLGIELSQAHRALADAEATALLFIKLLDRLEQFDLSTLSEAARISGRMGSSLHDLIKAAFSRRSKNPFADHGMGAGAGRSAAAVEPVPLRATGDRRPLDLDQVSDFFAPHGAFGRSFVGYEARAPQVEMARAVADSFNNSGTLMVEAGTGTGKSMAYLVPSVLQAVRRGERVVVSTNTINLQDQLFNKDIPDLQRIMAEAGEAPFDAALLKGRSNYLCLKRYYELERGEQSTPEEAAALLTLMFWMPTTASGDRNEVPLHEKEQSVWSRVNVNPENCSGPRCPHFQECYFFRARRRAEAAHVVVVNHALMIADLASQATVIPEYQHLVIDEAHNLEDVATDQLSFTLDQARLLRCFDDLLQTGGFNAVSGLLSDIPRLVHDLNGGGSAGERILTAIKPLGDLLTRTRSTVYDWYNQLNRFVVQQGEDSQYDTRLRLTNGVRALADWGILSEQWDNLAVQLGELNRGLDTVAEQLQLLNSGGDLDDMVMRVDVQRRFIGEVLIRVEQIVSGAADQICWLAQDRTREHVTLIAAPLSVAEILQRSLFAEKQSTVLASATMSVAGNFNFIRERIGAPASRELTLESPFDFESQVLVYIPNDMPEPSERTYQKALDQAMIALCRATEGRTLGLFTATNALRQTYNGIAHALEQHNIAVMAQSIDGSRRALIERFRQQPRSVLLGTTSFWEGVDVVGDALSVLAIAKLPFAVPNDPVIAARSEQFADAFNEFSIPQSILRFKQGFGRLIRSKEDRGIVVIFDRRLLSKKYGRLFLDSLPRTNVRTGTLAQLPKLAARFLATEPPNAD
jgi:predicted DnaQ family exonuclease/DinG family helicase